MIETQKFIRKPLYVDAVRITSQNFDEIVSWCQGEVQQDELPEGGKGKKYIKVRVHNPKNPRQTKAFVGDWLLYTDRGYKVYTTKAFHQSFDAVQTLTAVDDVSDAKIQKGGSRRGPLVEEEQGKENSLTTEPPESAEAKLDYPDGGVPAYSDPELVPATSENTAQWNHDHTSPIKEGEPVVPASVEGKRVLSLVEQEELSPEEVRELIQAGEVVLAQDVAAS